MKSNIWAILILSILSAVICIEITVTLNSFFPNQGLAFSMQYLPGIIYGLILGSYYLLLQKKDRLRRILLFTFYSFISYAFAYFSATLAATAGAIFVLITGLYGPLFIAGGAGGFLLLKAFRSLIYAFNSELMKPLVIISGILSFSFVFSVPIQPVEHRWLDFGNINNFAALLLVWQPIMAILLHFSVIRSKQTVSEYKLDYQMYILAIIVGIFILGSTIYFYRDAFNHSSSQLVPQFSCIGNCK
jgi:hypothetical protein